eukprot:TRINITY_DN4140_c0_g1_i3.p1 TRINITY_DN4140_c0_g1~~TRINITY_DN4140_c0_g1_i3.p1  ORF type:complete len:490 (+),score=81.50 TRINITY_DN4140_c0_g1_i3:191-1471(+)
MITNNITVSWDTHVHSTSPLMFGTNDFLLGGGSVSEATQPAYHALMHDLLNVRFVRVHNEGLPNNWTNNRTKSWNATIIKELYDSYDKAYTSTPVTFIQTIPTWPVWMFDGKVLPSSLWPEYAQLCADLVKILNIDQKRSILFWEPFNEIDFTFTYDEMVQLWTMIAKSMMAVDPSIKVGGLTLSWARTNYIVDFIKTAGKMTGFLSWHSYFMGDSTTVTTDDILTKGVAFFRSTVLNVQGALSSGGVDPSSVPLFMNEYNMLYEWHNAEPRLFNNIGAIFYASVHKVFMETQLTGANNWNAEDGIFGLMDLKNNPRPSAYVFGWSNTYLVGSLVSYTSDNPLLEIVAVSNSNNGNGADSPRLAAYIINKQNVTASFTLSQSGKYTLGDTTTRHNIINATGVFQNIPLSVTSTLTITPYTLWLIHN